MKCPNKKCNEEMTKVMIAGIEIEYCPKCRGMWFDTNELRQIKDTKDFSLRWIDFDLWKNKKNFKISPDMKLCPIDRIPLYEVMYGDSGIKVDVCNLCHGIWLDRGEFHKLLKYLEETKKKDLLDKYSDVLIGEMWEVFTGPKELREELRDVVSVLKIFRYKFLLQHPEISKIILSLPR